MRASDFHLDLPQGSDEALECAGPIENTMTLYYFDPAYMEHDTGAHPENAGRLQAVTRHLSFTGVDALCKRQACPPISRERLEYVHTADYIDSVEELARRGGGRLDEDTVVSLRSFDVALIAAGAAVDAVEQVVRGADRNAFCLSRPPGHHALPNRAMGFCLFNNIALAASVARRELGIQRLLIVDWDVHHGNGTQDIFYADPTVGFLSMHRWPFWPGTGAASEIGTGEGIGANRNIPIEFGTSRDEQLRRFSSELDDFAQQIQPELILLSAGFDSHRTDPVGSLGLETEDFVELTRAVMRVADQYAEGRLVSILEGGYNPDALTDCVEVHLETLLQASYS